MVGKLPEQAAMLTAKREKARRASALANVRQLAPAMQAFSGKQMGEYNQASELAYQQQADTLYAINVPEGVSPTEGRVTVPAGYPLQAPDRTDVDIDLVVRYKEQEDVYLTTYDATFSGDYDFTNPNTEDPSRIVLTFPFPPNVNTLSRLTMTVNGKEATQTRTSMRGITWAGWFKPEESKTIHVEYEAQGIDDYSYAVDHDRLNKYFRLVANVTGVDELELPNDCLRLREKKKIADGFQLTWFHKGLVTNRDIMIDLPDREPELTFAARLQKYADRFAVLCRVAPLFALLFIGAIGLSAWVGAPRLNAESHVLLALNFLLFFPLLIFLAGFTGVAVAFWISVGVIALLAVLYAWRTGGLGMLWRVVVFTGVFLGLFSYAVLHERWTGLLLSAGGIAVVALFMLSHALWPPEPREPESPPDEDRSPDRLVPAPVGNPHPPAEGSFCAHCGTALGEGFRFCPSCAQPVHETTACAACGAEVCAACGREFKHCPACGAKLGSA